jgi:hypothetical protein
MDREHRPGTPQSPHENRTTIPGIPVTTAARDGEAWPARHRMAPRHSIRNASPGHIPPHRSSQVTAATVTIPDIRGTVTRGHQSNARITAVAASPTRSGA